MKTSAELRARLDALRASITELTDLESVTDEQEADLSAQLDEFERISDTDLPAAEKRERLVAKVQDGSIVPQPVDVPNVIRQPAEVDALTSPISEVRDAAKRLIDAAVHLPAEQKEAALQNATGRTKDRDGDRIARMIVASERPEYQSAFVKALAGNEAEWSDDERRAAQSFRNAMSSTDAAGGYGVPTLIDPTVLITDGTGLAGILDYCRIETITNDAWKGVSAGNTSWSFDAEAAEVSDDTSTFAQPTVTAHMARGFVPYSIEIEQDYPGFASEVAKVMADGYMDLLASNLMVGTGSGAPFGIFTTTTTKVDVTTDNTFGAEDLDAVWAAVPEKFRANSVWVMNVDVENDIRGFGSGTATSRFTIDQTQEGISRLNGKPVVLSDYAPEWSGTDAANILAVGDPRNFLVAQRAGMVVERIQTLFGTTNARPTGQRGFFAHARVGSDIVVQNSWRLLKNQTT